MYVSKRSKITSYRVFQTLLVCLITHIIDSWSVNDKKKLPQHFTKTVFLFLNHPPDPVSQRPPVPV